MSKTSKTSKTSNMKNSSVVSGCPERRRTRIRVEVRKRNAFKKKN